MRADLKQNFHTGWVVGIILGVSLLVHVASPILGSTLLAGWHCVHHPVHAAIEMAGAIIAFVVAHLLMTLHRRGEGTSFNVAIAGALVGMGALDGLHALVHAGNTFVFLHSFASFAGGLLFALVWLPSRWTSLRMNWWPWAVFAVVAVMGAISMAQPEWAPVMVRDGVFTPTAKFLNLAGGFLMFAAAVRLVLKYRTSRNVDDVLFCLHCGLFGAAAVMFEQSTLWDFAWWGWHVLRLMAYGVALWFMIVSDERTVQKALHNVRRQKERRHQLMQAAINTANESMFTIDSRGRFVEVNQTACDRLKYSREELLSMSVWQINSRLSSSHWGQLWHDIQDTRCHLFETEHRTKSGRVFPVEVSKVLVDIDGEEYVCDFVRDITERKEAERAVQESEARFQQLASHLDDVLWIRSVDAVEIIYVSPAYESVWGRTCESLYEHPGDWMDGIHPEDRERLVAAFHERNPQYEYEETFRVVRPNGSMRWVHAKAIPIRNAAGEVYRIAGVARDVTEAKEANEQLSRLKTSLDQTNDCVFMFRPDTFQFYYCNRGATRQVGYSHDELLQMTPLDIKPEFDETQFRRMLEPLVDGREESLRFAALVHRHKDGHEIPVEILLQYVAPADEPARFVAVVRDITERKHIEELMQAMNVNLQTTTSFQRTILNSADYSIIATDPNGLITAFNRGAERLLGYGANDIIGKVTPEIIHDKDEVVTYAQELSEELGCSIKPGFETFIAKAQLGDADEREWTYVCKDGSRVTVLLSVTAIRNEDDMITGYMGVAQDIMAQKESERQLRNAKQQAEAASLAKSQFLASMSHELRTPLNGVIGMTELLAGTNLTEKQRQFADACRNSGEALLQLINDILDFSKIEAGKLELDLHDFDLEKLVTDTVETMSWCAVDKSLEMPCYVDQASRIVLNGDSSRVRQVLVNLLGNAIKFTEAGEIVVRTKNRRKT